MNNGTLFNRIVAISAITSAPLALAASVIVGVAVDFNFDLMVNTAQLISLDGQSAELFRWGELTGLFGYGLLLLPVALYLWFWLRPYGPRLLSLFLVFGLAYLLLCAVGAALRASLLPAMMHDFSQAVEAQQQILSTIFKTVTFTIFVSMGSLESLLGGVWCLGTGLILQREWRGLGIGMSILGILLLGSGVGTILGVEQFAMFDLVYFLSPLWFLWLGIAIASKDRPVQLASIVPTNS